VTGRLWVKVKKIATAIKEFRKNPKDIAIDIDENDEILYAIADQFNKMASEITTLVAELKEKNKHVAMVMDQRRKAEIRALQAQINPHFIYNALDRINWIAIDNDQHEISSMLSGLASLLRYSISNIDILVTLKAEIQWMEKYIFIQGKRFDKKIDFVCSVYGDAIDFPIYKMLLQPLVENSILHGFAHISTGSRIELSARILQDARLKVILSDNGAGMDSEVLAKIHRMIEQKGNCETDNIGINNVINRLWLYYGDEAEISVESIKNTGTTFTIIIPYREQA
jgi:sensor histidine kinase YesM